MKTRDERYDIYDRIPHEELRIWPFEDEMNRFGKTRKEWEAIFTEGEYNEEYFWLFYEGLIQTTILELDKLGLLK